MRSTTQRIGMSILDTRTHKNACLHAGPETGVFRASPGRMAEFRSCLAAHPFWAYDEALRRRRTPVFVDESRFYLLPGRVRTYAPEGHTPILHEWQTRDRFSVMGGVAPAGSIFATGAARSRSNGLHTIKFLKYPMRHFGSRILVIGDGSPIKELLGQQPPRSDGPLGHSNRRAGSRGEGRRWTAPNHVTSSRCQDRS